MPTTFERFVALREAGELLNLIARHSEKHKERYGSELPHELRRQAWQVLRDYPTAQEIDEGRTLHDLLDSLDHHTDQGTNGEAGAGRQSPSADTAAGLRMSQRTPRTGILEQPTGECSLHKGCDDDQSDKG